MQAAPSRFVFTVVGAAQRPAAERRSAGCARAPIMPGRNMCPTKPSRSLT